jgi:hypothetical protein
MAKQTVSAKGVSIPLACEFLSVSETCYRYEAKKNAENEQIADWLIRLRATSETGALGFVTSICATSKDLAGTSGSICRSDRNVSGKLPLGVPTSPNE